MGDKNVVECVESRGQRGENMYNGYLGGDEKVNSKEDKYCEHGKSN